MKLKCNKCYCDLEIVEYDCGVFVEPCENCTMSSDELEELLVEQYDLGEEKGYDDAAESFETRIEEAKDISFDKGYEEGYDDGHVSGYDEGKKDARKLIHPCSC
jgi:hypothetical protein